MSLVTQEKFPSGLKWGRRSLHAIYVTFLCEDLGSLVRGTRICLDLYWGPLVLATAILIIRVVVSSHVFVCL